MSDPELDQPPAAPSRMRSDFSARMDNFLAYIEQTLVAQLAALVAWINARAAEMAGYASSAAQHADQAQASATVAVAAAEAPEWVPEDPYAFGEIAWSPQDGQVYRCMIPHEGLDLDPASNGSGRWKPLTVNGDEFRLDILYWS